ncbi:hypothetical protein [Caulobacter sp. 17J65-9]|uniref:hypothetical protein n=1 Tax=Caulobacter sp. 17J65-9 TaxID=2709382 RepID=UPI0013C6E3F4|nr:hypothetical protein [Caulobacter sp. 17J65-9]NEX91597.1 hypothetical protein [Caulobacter sp. 17J65-9]
MVAVTADGVGRFDMGRVVQRTFGVLGRNAQTFGALAVLLSGLPQVLLYWGAGSMGLSAASGAPNFASFPLMALGGLAMFVGTFVLQAALTHGTVADLNGKRVTFGSALSTGGRFMLPLLGLGILMGLAFMVGYLLLIVPGIMLSVAWAVAAPVLVVEQRGVTETFGRSADLTRGNRWAIFGLGVAYLVVTWLVGAMLGGVAGVIGMIGGPTGQVLGSALGQGVASVFTSLVGTAGIAAIYYELRSAKEGVGVEALASVFD